MAKTCPLKPYLDMMIIDDVGQAQYTTVILFSNKSTYCLHTTYKYSSDVNIPGELYNEVNICNLTRGDEIPFDKIPHTTKTKEKILEAITRTFIVIRSPHKYTSRWHRLQLNNYSFQMNENGDILVATNLMSSMPRIIAYGNALTEYQECIKYIPKCYRGHKENYVCTKCAEKKNLLSSLDKAIVLIKTRKILAEFLPIIIREVDPLLHKLILAYYF